MSLKFDTDTVCTIGCGIVVGLFLLWAISLLLALLFWGSLAGAFAAASGS